MQKFRINRSYSASISQTIISSNYYLQYEKLIGGEIKLLNFLFFGLNQWKLKFF